jgi:hypothetical protein
MTIVQILKNDGWRDWHILMAIASAASNYRYEQLHQKLGNGAEDFQTMQQTMFRIINQPESDKATPIPVEIFSEENLRINLSLSQFSTLRGLGLEAKQNTPDFEAVNHFLKIRYHYWDDDIAHLPLFD